MKKRFQSFGMRVLTTLFVLLTFAISSVAYVTASPESIMLAIATPVMWPFGNADLLQPAYSATLAVTINDNLTILDPSILTGAMTINLTISKEVQKGAMLFVELTATATEVTTFGTGFTAPTVAGVAGKTKCQLFIYDGTTFKPTAVAFQID